MAVGMQPAFGREHKLPQKWPESMYLLDKKIYLKNLKHKKNLSAPKLEILISLRCVKKYSKVASRADLLTLASHINMALCDWIYLVKW